MHRGYLPKLRGLLSNIHGKVLVKTVNSATRGTRGVHSRWAPPLVEDVEQRGQDRGGRPAKIVYDTVHDTKDGLPEWAAASAAVGCVNESYW